MSQHNIIFEKEKKKGPKSTILYNPKNLKIPLREDSEQVNKQAGEQRKSIGFN
jgi:hypothetical protein